MELIVSATEALQHLLKEPGSRAYIDVRAPVEFESGHLPHTINLPILTNVEREQIGTLYKKEGKQAAITRGHELVGPFKDARIEKWTQSIHHHRGKPGILFCWRGGLRSQTAAEWIRKTDCPVMTVHGGYKAMRALLLNAQSSFPPLTFLSGLTGSGKSKLLHDLKARTSLPVVDLESLANHRGSSFGLKPLETQPTQASFENALGLELMRYHERVIVEDESRNIGRLFLPIHFVERKSISNFVVLQSTQEERIKNIFSEYVDTPLREERTAQHLKNHLISCLDRISKKLGGLLTDDIKQRMNRAFDSQAYTDHAVWIDLLLQKYYDPLYHYSFKKQNRNVVFQGSHKECFEWFQQYG